MSICLRRREFVAALGGAAASPLAAHAQQPGRMRRIGMLMTAATDGRRQSEYAAIRQGLRQLGWTDGQNVRIEVRWSAGDSELARISRCN